MESLVRKKSFLTNNFAFILLLILITCISNNPIQRYYTSVGFENYSRALVNEIIFARN